MAVIGIIKFLSSALLLGSGRCWQKVVIESCCHDTVEQVALVLPWVGEPTLHLEGKTGSTISEDPQRGSEEVLTFIILLVLVNCLSKQFSVKSVLISKQRR